MAFADESMDTCIGNEPSCYQMPALVSGSTFYHTVFVHADRASALLRTWVRDDRNVWTRLGDASMVTDPAFNQPTLTNLVVLDDGRAAASFEGTDDRNGVRVLLA